MLKCIIINYLMKKARIASYGHTPARLISGEGVTL